MGGEPAETPPAVQRKQDVTSARNLEDRGPPEEVQGQSRNGIGLPAHHQNNMLPPSPHPRRRHDNGYGA